MNKEKMHISIAEIYKAAENISDLLSTLNTILMVSLQSFISPLQPC